AGCHGGDGGAPSTVDRRRAARRGRRPHVRLGLRAAGHRPERHRIVRLEERFRHRPVAHHRRWAVLPNLERVGPRAPTVLPTVSRRRDLRAPPDRPMERHEAAANQLTPGDQSSVAAGLLWACLFAAAFAGCASPPSSGPPDAGGPGLPVVSAARFDAGGPDAEEYGASNGYPIGARGTFLRPPFLVGSHSHLDEIFAGRFVRRATTPSRLARAASEPTLRYDYEGKSFTVDDYLARHPVTGLLLAWDTFARVGTGGVDAVRKFNERVRPSGTRFYYASVETQVLGLVLTSALGRPVAEYLEQKIWQPMGAEADATWLVDRSGQESTYCCLNAVLRDYARLGLL